MNPGTIFFDEDFVFVDGNSAPKLFIVLGMKDDLMVVTKTTSKGHRYSNTYGCQAKNRFSAFFLPQHCCLLNENTWVCLDEFYSLRSRELLEKMLSNQIKRLGVLPGDITEQLLLCTVECDDISSHQEQIVREALKGAPFT